MEHRAKLKHYGNRINGVGRLVYKFIQLLIRLISYKILSETHRKILFLLLRRTFKNQSIFITFKFEFVFKCVELEKNYPE